MHLRRQEPRTQWDVNLLYAGIVVELNVSEAERGKMLPALDPPSMVFSH